MGVEELLAKVVGYMAQVSAEQSSEVNWEL